MSGYLGQLAAYPKETLELAISTIVANFLALGPPIFVILVLNKFITYGVRETLYTLASGGLILVALEYYFRRYKYGVAEKLCTRYNNNVSPKDISNLISKNPSIFYLLPVRVLRQLVNSYSLAAKIFTASNVCLLADAPFAIFFAFVIYLISPVLGCITIIFICLFCIILLFGIKQQIAEKEKLKSRRNKFNSLNEFIINNFETIDYHDANHLNSALVRELNAELTFLDNKQSERQDNTQCFIRSGTAILTVLIVAFGAILVVNGELNIGEMIGVNILAARSLVPIIAITQQARGWVELRDAKILIEEFESVKEERTEGIAINNLQAVIELKNVSFSFGGRHGDVIDHLGLEIRPGEPLCIHGSNGAGKSTLARILTGQLQPRNGAVFVDGINLKQISKSWWRQQIIYVPQFPNFFEGTVRQNFLAYNKGLTADNIRKLIFKVGLDKVVDSTPSGIDTNLDEIPKLSALGYRKRLAYARALAHNGQVIIIDDPLIGVDEDGVRIILELLTQLVSSKKLIIIISNDERVFKGCGRFLNLDDGGKVKIKNVKNI